MTNVKEYVLEIKIDISTNIDKNYIKFLCRIKILWKKLLSDLKMENVFKLISKR